MTLMAAIPMATGAGSIEPIVLAHPCVEHFKSLAMVTTSAPMVAAPINMENKSMKHHNEAVKQIDLSPPKIRCLL